MVKSILEAIQSVANYGQDLSEGKAVLAFDKKGNLVGRYKDMATAKKLKPGHRYGTDDGKKEYGVDTERKLASMKTEETELYEAKKKKDDEAKKAPVTKKDDDGEGMDPVGKGDDDIDNDGDSDDSDKYLKKRRKAISNSIQKVKEALESMVEGEDTRMGTITVNSDEERKKRAEKYRRNKK